MDKIDLRSDTVTKPSEGMRKAMYDAETGDDVFGEDPTVNKFQEYAAELLGFEAALFVFSGVMGNQLCLKTHSQPHDEVICDAESHIFYYESGSPAVLSGLQIFPVFTPDGILTPEAVLPAIRPKEAYYMPRTKIVAVENTHNRRMGKVYSIEQIDTLCGFVRSHNLIFHLDGARAWNAAVYLGVEPKEITAKFDSVSACLSKGLGAPIGSVIAGTKEFIQEAFRFRKAWGGGTRQLGVLAAAGIYALQNNRERLADDHRNAQTLAEAIANMPQFRIDAQRVETNILLFSHTSKSPEEVINECEEKGLRLSPGPIGTVRAITHLDVSKNDIIAAIEILRKV
ncbi:MAG: aminotransferase class I/II-fold pyridoxal phosphate-dependent enzyme [Ignavibacteriales bacterium]|nr:MAG: aminotransferase class I/II-fold pyridoxal phosphate-dependent enzyme [Ignavibacteriaceae bacterium]MBW7872549.1 aminotransferase class I/II-fold pyridoxal phosphate-dependent enzyme [Ignavibacteria bacterium]MCZ2141898.1 aminotransferase class I/II-fold pyridoxal phosphate-dependent enzyme [Ignavibacteriales bacterium]OQY75840.1 MAG: low specificity L-threonine aldolase [Ignavibacteriales bacterium UTCHB3]MBV6445065.1 L-allo-threonine aldolase [Ignavibacteriaceae bacterium]